MEEAIIERAVWGSQNASEATTSIDATDARAPKDGIKVVHKRPPSLLWSGFRVLPKIARRKITFGRYAGERLGLLPGSYLSFLCRKLENRRWGHWAQLILDARQRLGVTIGDASDRPMSPSRPARGTLRRRMEREDLYGAMLKSCRDAAAVDAGTWLHRRIVRRGLDNSAYLGNLLMQMYAACGRTRDAAAAFESLGGNRNAFSWTHLFAAFARNGQLREARRVFDAMPSRDVVAYTGAISVHGHAGEYDEAMALYRAMLLDGMQPDRATFLAALAACTDAAIGAAVHLNAVECGRLDADAAVGASIVAMYGRCGQPDAAAAAFCGVRKKTELALTALLAALVENGHHREALEAFLRFDSNPDPLTYVIVLDACGSLAAEEYGRWVHSKIPKCFQRQGKVGTALVNMYGRCGRLDDAKRCFKRILRKDGAAWNAVIAAHAGSKKAVQLFYKMVLHGSCPCNSTFLTLLFTCGLSKDLELGCDLFVDMVGEHGLERDARSVELMARLLEHSGEQELASQLLASFSLTFSSLSLTRTPVAWRSRLMKRLDAGFGVEVPKVVPDVFGLLKQKLMPEQDKVTAWLDTDVPGRKFELVKHHLYQ